jgi:hypothetical protein
LRLAAEGDTSKGDGKEVRSVRHTYRLHSSNYSGM